MKGALDMKAEIISISTDILQGKAQDQNVMFLAKELTNSGIEVQKSSFVKASPEMLIEAIEQAGQDIELLVLIGGLGPDEEDITKQTLSDYLEQPLVLDQPSEDKIITYHKNSNFVMPERNQLQAMILQESLPIRNVTGLAVGLYYQSEEKAYLLLPGPFDELEPTYIEEAKPILMDKLLNNRFFESRVLRLFGLSEVELTKKLEPIMKNQIHVYPMQNEIEIQINVQEKDKEAAVQKADALRDEVYERVEDYVYSEESQSLLETVKQLLTDEGLMITAAESLTGGEFLSSLSRLEEASKILNGGMVTYSNEVKNKNLGVTKQTIEKHGVVSAQCAIEMAEKVMKKFDVDIGVSLTGVAGPSSLEGEIPGTVWIGLAKEGMETIAKKHHFAYKRNQNRQLSVLSALDMVRRLVLDKEIEGAVTLEKIKEDPKQEPQ